jgi:hypothetical protein
MPSKTRKEKIIADYRRRLRLLQESQDTTPLHSDIDAKQTDSKQPSSTASTTDNKKHIVSEEDILITSYFKKDFKKSLLLIAIVITLEISLYFATINNYLRLGR